MFYKLNFNSRPSLVPDVVYWRVGFNDSSENINLNTELVERSQRERVVTKQPADQYHSNQKMLNEAEPAAVTINLTMTDNAAFQNKILPISCKL